jgi:hypothetical protein
MFLQQLPRPYSSPDLQLDDATLPLAIIISALRNPTSVPAVDARRRQDVALRILVLVSQVLPLKLYVQLVRVV